jgi:hypothetical protein
VKPSRTRRQYPAIRVPRLIAVGVCNRLLDQCHFGDEPDGVRNSTVTAFLARMTALQERLERQVYDRD